MKKVLSGILALTLACILSVSAFAAEGDITVTEITINDETVSMESEPLKADADTEEGMLRISPSMLLKIKLKLESDDTEDKTMSFLTNQKLEADEAISKDKLQYVDEKTIAADGTVSIQFRPRLNQPVGIYNMRANTEGASSMFSKFYKVVADGQSQPSMPKNASDTPKKKDIEITVSNYTPEWRAVNKLYDITGNTEIPEEEYEFIIPEATPRIATLKIKTTGDWATQGPHKFRFKSTDIGYNPITFDVNITEPEDKVISSSFVSSTGKKIPDEIQCEIELPETAKKNEPVEVKAVAPKGYYITDVSYQPVGGVSQSITASEGKYIFTMPDKAVNVKVTVTPKTYTLQLDLQGGIGIDNTTIRGTVEALPQLPSENPTRQDYNFTNWRTEPNGGGNVVTNEHFNTIDKMLAFFGESEEKIIYARWTERGKFTVAYIASEAGVTNKPSDSNTYDQETTAQIAIPEQEPERAGYTFKGWKVDGDDAIYKYGSENAVYTNIASIQDSLKFYAQWEIVTYKITLQNGNDSREINCTVENIPQLEAQTKDGYEFKGWFTSETGGEKVEAITAANIAGLTTLYAQWEKILVTSNITSELVSSTGKTIPDGLGGSITVSDTATEGNAVKVTASAPNGYNITSVAYQPEGGDSQTITETEGKYSFTMPDKAVNVTVTVTPKTYTLQLDLQGGSGIDNTTITGTVEDLSLQLPSEKPTREDYNFTNWRTEAEGGDVVKNEHLDTAVKLVNFFKDADTRTLYAQWLKDGKFRVAYIVEEAGVENKPSDATVYDKDTVTEIAISEQEPTLTGYTFLGWQVKGDSTYYKHGSSNNVYTNIDGIDKVLEFYAKWELKTYTITLQDGEASNTIRGTIESLPTLTTPTKDGYDFKGWFTEETGGEKIEAITVDNISELTTLYARWEEIQSDDYEIVSADRANNKVNVIKRTEESAYIIVATYAANRNLVKATIKDISDIKTNATGAEVEVAGAFDGDYATANVFMWNSLDKMQPRCPALPINK